MPDIAVTPYRCLMMNPSARRRGRLRSGGPKKSVQPLAKPAWLTNYKRGRLHCQRTSGVVAAPRKGAVRAVRRGGRPVRHG